MSDPRDPGHPIGPEMDDSPNPTAAAPDMGEPAGGHADSRQHDMLRQLQQMIDQLATQAGPPMREIAAKAAELAALAAQRAGPLAAKAAEKTQVYGERFAAKSKEVAADLRSQARASTETAEQEADSRPATAPEPAAATSGERPSEDAY
jgi:maltooligosyltrehalose synthase